VARTTDGENNMLLGILLSTTLALALRTKLEKYRARHASPSPHRG
jgi:hypothetical protein